MGVLSSVSTPSSFDPTHCLYVDFLKVAVSLAQSSVDRKAAAIFARVIQGHIYQKSFGSEGAFPVLVTCC